MAEPAETTKMVADGISVNSPMEEQVQRLANKVWKKYQSLDGSQRYLIGIVGIPGSGKTTFASSLGYAVNRIYHEDRHKKYPNAPDISLQRPRSPTNGSSHHRHWSDANAPDIAHVLPMDGFHLTRAQLSTMPDPEEAHYRRGAAFTFDSKGYLKLISDLQKPIEPTTRTIWAPSFDHAIKDPVENDIAIPPTAKIVIVEGLYTALWYPHSKLDDPTPDTTTGDEPSPWSQACLLMDEIYQISVPIAIATERVAKRNFKAGLSPSLEAALDRTRKNDMKNAQYILDHLPPPAKLTERIESVEDERWKTEEQLYELLDETQQKEEQDQAREVQKLKLERMGSIAELVDAGAGM